MKGEGKKRKSAEVRVCASARGRAHVHARSGGTGAGGRGRGNEAEDGAGQRGGRSADESANENNKKGGDFEKPPSFCIMSVNPMLFLGRRGGEKLTLHARDGELASPSARCSERFHRRECDRAAFEKHFLSLLSLAGCLASQYNFMVGAVRQRQLYSRLYLSLSCVCLKVRIHFVRSYERIMPE